ncbi:MAG: hypothetical protein WD749_03745 [Phycisphaerales bacterium]
MRTTFPSLAAAALAASVPLSLALAAGLPIGDEPPACPAAAAECNSTLVEKARKLLRDNKPVAARAALLRVFQGAAQPSDEHAKEAMTLLGEANRRIRDLDPLTNSLQKAEIALDAGDVRTAERHLQAVITSAAVTPRQVDAAKALRAVVDARRAELSPAVPDALAQARRDFDAGRYAQAKAGLQMVDRSGVTLSAEQQNTLDGYQVKLVALASREPALFSSPASMGMLQPGVIRRRDEQPAAPAGEQPPAPAPAPAAQPEQPPPPAPAPQPAGEDPIRQAQRFEAQNLLAQADRAFEERRLNEAQGRYFRIRSEFREFLTPEQLRHVENRLQEARVMMAAPGTAPTPDQVLAQDTIARQRLIAEFDSDMTQAAAALRTGNTSEARTRAASARLRISSGRGQLISQTEYEGFDTRVSALLAEVDRTEAEIRRIEQARADAETQRRDAEQVRIARSEKERKIVELIDRARAYQSEMRYDEALQAIDQLLFLDPINPTGLLLRDLISDIRFYRLANEIYDRKQLGYAEQSMQNQIAGIPPAHVMTYPLDWPAVSVRRGEPLQFAESAENKAAMAQLNATRIPTVAFNNNPLADAVQFLSTISHQNIDVDWASLEEAGITRETPVSLNLNNITAKTALDRLTEKVSLGTSPRERADWAILDGVVTVASDERIRKNTLLHIYDVRDLLIEVPDYRDVPRIDLQQALQAAQGGQGGGQSPFQEDQGDDQEQERRELEERLDDIISIITNNVDYDGWVDNGGDTGKIQRHQGNLIITNTPKNHRQVAGLLSKLREIRAMQINVETRFLLVNQDWFEQIGFDLDVYINANNNQFRTGRAADRSLQPGDFFEDGRLRRTVTGQQAPNAATTTPAGTQLTQAFINPNSFSPIGFQSDSLGLAAGLAPTRGIAADILGRAPALGIAGQFLDDVQVDFLIQATQADRRSIQLTAPRLTFTNGQIANIYVATQQAFVSDLDVVIGDSAVGFDPIIGVVTEGVTLLVEGTVTADRRYVQLNVDAGVARIDGFGQQPVSAVAGGQLVNSAETQSFIQLPRVTVTRVRTTVTVPDQGTILMGGQRLVSESEVEAGVPVLSKVPILNRFFSNRVESKEEQTLLILLKPTILIQNEEEERQFPGLLESYRSGIGG